MHLTSEQAVRRLAQREPVDYMIFDLLYLDGRSLLASTYVERRAALAELGLTGATWQAPAHHLGDGPALLEASRARGWRASWPSAPTPVRAGAAPRGG